MAFSVRDPETDRVVRALAQIKGKGLTETIREAAQGELRRTQSDISLMERIEAIQREVAKYPSTGEKADKAFFDSLNDE